MKLNNIIILAWALFTIAPAAFGWSALEHKIIAEVAYEHLTPHTRDLVDYYTKVLDHKYPARTRLYYSAIWPDLLSERDGITAFKNWHFINYPYSPDGTPTQPFLRKNNVAWAIGEAEQTLTNPQPSKPEKALALRFLLHFVGDAHQPLHCVTLYSKQYPNGDGGGNLIPLKMTNATELHQLWDQAVGAYDNYLHQHVSVKTIISLAHNLQAKYPESYFGNTIKDPNPWHWTRESYKIATNFAYKTSSTPSATYLNKGQQLAEQRIALAGYRLAYTLRLSLN